MKVSIVTASFNSADTIEATLRSVASQSHADIEHIVVDGGSSDGTADRVRHGGGRVDTFLSEPDDGIYDAMNKGLRLATGDVVGFLNADDVYADDDAVARIVETFAAGGADAVYGDLVYVDRRDLSRIRRYWRSGSFTRRDLAFGWMAPHPTLYVRRDRIKASGGFRRDMRIAADYEFMLRLLGDNRLRVSYCETVLVRMRTGGASNRSLRQLLKKSREDLSALRANGIGGVLTLLCKVLRKLPQFFARPPPERLPACR